MFTAVNDPRRPRVAPKTETVTPAVDFAPIARAIDALTKRAAAYDAARAAAAKSTVSAAARERRAGLKTARSGKRA